MKSNLNQYISISDENLIRTIGTSRVNCVSLKNFAPKVIKDGNLAKRQNPKVNYGLELKEMEKNNLFKKELTYFIAKWSIFIKQLEYGNLNALPPKLEDFFEPQILKKIREKFTLSQIEKDYVKLREIGYNIGIYGIVYTRCCIETDEKNIIVCMNLRRYSIGFKIIDAKIVSSLK